LIFYLLDYFNWKLLIKSTAVFIFKAFNIVGDNEQKQLKLLYVHLNRKIVQLPFAGVQVQDF